MRASDRDRALRLEAQDEEDLKVVSAALQDAIVRVGDLAHDPVRRTFTLVANRFRWERARRSRANERVRSALQIAGVLAVRARGLAREPEDAVAALLAVEFTPDPEPPGGAVMLIFAGGGAIAVTVECVDARLADVSRPWPTRRRPDHGD
ncbi:MAG: DUF2948 family protein [Caulobacterales bacterium]|nr:DUF2948 family protein [Caulobacterales bacterium]